MSPRLVLVTGGAGFIGSNVVAQLAADPTFDVAVCDRLRTADGGKWRNLAKHAIVDIFPPDALMAWLDRHEQDLDLVIHMGAVSSTTEPDADLIVQTNFGLSRDLFQWCSTHARRIIYASSAATYGDGASGFDDGGDLSSLAALRPLNPYGWSKTLFDQFAVRQALRDRAPPQWVGLKFFNVYGPNEGHKGAMRSVIAQIWPDVAAGEAVRLFKSDHPDYQDGGQMRDFVYVRDAAEIVAWLARTPSVSGLFNLGSGTARSFKDLAHAVFRAAGRTARIDYVEMPGSLRGRYQYFTQGKIDRLLAAGYPGAVTSLEDGVADYVGRYLSAADPFR